MDQCTHCTMRGNPQGCLATKCNQHESWMVGELRQILVDIKNEVGDSLPSEDNGILCTPVERLAHSVYLIAMRGWVSHNVPSELNDGLDDDIKCLREHLTEKHIKCVFDAATTIGCTYQHNRAVHIMYQEIPLLTLYGILNRAHRISNVELRGCALLRSPA